MRTTADGGFTLVEMMMAMAITAAVAVSAMAALDQLVDADARATQSLEDSVGVHRALQMLRRDVADAVALTVESRRCTATQRDGTVVVYTICASDTELQRTIAASAAAVEAVPVDTLSPVGHTARGHLRDVDYRADAVLQGMKSINLVPVIGQKTGSIIGCKARIEHDSAHGVQIADALGMCWVLVEAEAKP